MALRSICVFCGARPGHDPAHAAAAVTLGRTLAEQGIRLVYGGGAVGLMGIVADAALAAGTRRMTPMPCTPGNSRGKSRVPAYWR